jgi:hypothetical protein
MFDLPVPLPGNTLAILRMPRPMTGKDYDFMVTQLDANLKAYRTALVVDDATSTEKPDVVAS